MALALAFTPTAPVAKDVVSLSATGTTGNLFKFEVTSVPSASKVALGMLLGKKGEALQSFTPDVAGAFGVRVYAYRQRIGTSSRANDPAGGVFEQLLGGADGTVAVGTAMELPIATRLGHGATLRLVVVDTTIRAAELVSPLSDLSRLAILDSTVVAALAAMVGVAASGIDVDFVTDVRTLQQKYTGHLLGASTWHAAADAVNSLRLSESYSAEAALSALADLYDKILAHEAYIGSHTHADTTNTPLVGKPSSLSQAIVCKADLRNRVYRRHILMDTTSTPTVHTQSGGDATNTMSSPLTLPALIVALLDVIAAASVSTPSNESSGTLTLEHAFGFAPQSSA